MSDDFMSDPLWYKDAIIYELHVRSFFDASNDGVGDFAGLQQKLPYLEDLGVNTLWLLPFLESPLRDDGYDTADFFKILPVHGTLEDFQEFLDAAHDRGMRVITELVLNHTSDQHPWFQEARDPGSPRHDWYVWSETTEKYEDARIIFTDTEYSNWTWDPKAGKYYWHRFFSHQPDLNYDNPEVHEAMKEVLFYWLDMGVDGLRLDAVPYLYEREGTSCENLPETLNFVQELRSAVEDRYGPGKVLQAEANQWPEDTLPYFGDGDGVQMSFNFPIMPRMFMALRRSNRRPLVEMIDLTNEIPEEAQWALFLRNHDELTLEMVTDEERDYMYNEYAVDSAFRINVGIRRRLTPLLGGERRRIELMNALLFSLKGSPIIYYGDEIGMGDDPFLGDRDGVRTPMQWSPDKNAGFSRAPYHKLFLPPISDGRYTYEFVNVEDAENDPHSLLNFTKRLVAMRKQHLKVFGRGSFELLPVENQHVLVFLREYEGKKILVVANLSQFAQSFFIPPSEALEGLVPVEMFSQSPFAPIENTPYHLTIGPHGFYWFALTPEEEIRETHREQVQMAPVDTHRELPVLDVPEGVENILIRTLVQDRSMERFEAILPEYMGDQRWFGGQSNDIASINVDDAVRIQAEPLKVYVSLLEVEFTDDSSAVYVLPLTVTYGNEADRILADEPQAAVAWLDSPRQRGLLHDATVTEDFWLCLFEWWQTSGKGRSLEGLYVRSIDEKIKKIKAGSATRLTGEQSNSAAIIDDNYFIKIYRRIEPGINPETELLNYLTEIDFTFVPHLHGSVTFQRGYNSYTLGILQEALDVEIDGWNYALNATGRFLDRIGETAPLETSPAADTSEEIPATLEEVAPEMLSLAQVLGIRTAELHRSFARAEQPSIKPEPTTTGSIRSLVDRIETEAHDTRTRLSEHPGPLPESPDPEEWSNGLRRLRELLPIDDDHVFDRIRIHGDYHLGQLIRADGEFFILDFEGEPARSIEERRQRDSALRDVAGMLRSLEYAALVALHENDEYDNPALRNWTHTLNQWCETVFSNAYFGLTKDSTFMPPEDAIPHFLWVYLFDKALYEVRYELDHRPSWVWLPLRGLTRLLHETPVLSVSTMAPASPKDRTD
jgi:maltose alpha-D-glucosyltransferase/alpha-amylase